MKYIIIPFIALGFVLSSLIGVGYYCNDWGMTPEYFGSPFIFKQKSLGSSLTYFYSVSGLLLNIAIWCVPIFLIRKLFLVIILKKDKGSLINKIYKALIVLLMIFTTLNIAFDYITLGSGFEKGRNYWYISLDEETSNWEVDCRGEWIMIKK